MLFPVFRFYSFGRDSCWSKKSLLNFKSILSFGKFHIPDGKRIPPPPAMKSQKIPAQREDWREWIEGGGGGEAKWGGILSLSRSNYWIALHFEIYLPLEIYPILPSPSGNADSLLNASLLLRSFESWLACHEFLVTMRVKKWDDDDGATHLCFLNILVRTNFRLDTKRLFSRLIFIDWNQRWNLYL